jgi:hypothetical protein
MKYLFGTAALVLFLSVRVSAADLVALGPDGLGPIKLGMDVAQLARQLAEPLVEPSNPEDRSCWYVESSKHPHVRFMIEDGRLRRIEVESPQIVAFGAIRVGDPEQAVARVFGKRVVKEPHKHGGAEDHYLTVGLNRHTAIRFETTSGKIDLFYIGGVKQVQYVEGCR